MTASSIRRPSLAPVIALVGAVAIVAGLQLASPRPAAGELGLDEPLLVVPSAEAAADGTAGGTSSSSVATGGEADRDELARVHANVGFWAARLGAEPSDVVAAVKLAESHVAVARLTGDVTAYLRAEAAADAALSSQPGYLPALGMRASVLVALHRFDEARDVAQGIVLQSPGDATALGVLGDASLELGDLEAAGRAYRDLAAVADGSAARVRTGRLAFILGDTASAVAGARSAVDAALDEGLEGDGLAFFWATLGEMLVATGDASAAREAFDAALGTRPGLPAALVGLARLDAFDGDLEAAIAGIDAAVSALPLPETLALRADLFTLRGGPGDAARAAADHATIEAVARLAGDDAAVYDRGLSLYLSDHALDPERAVRLAAAEAEVRRDVYGHDALAWALFNAGRPAEAAQSMAAALAVGTRDARLWYHAGLIAAANGDAGTARSLLLDALALGPALDPVARMRAESALEALR